MDNAFEVDPGNKFGQKKNAPIAKNVKTFSQEDLNNLVSSIKKLTNLINSNILKMIQ